MKNQSYIKYVIQQKGGTQIEKQKKDGFGSDISLVVIGIDTFCICGYTCHKQQFGYVSTGNAKGPTAQRKIKQQFDG